MKTSGLRRLFQYSRTQVATDETSYHHVFGQRIFGAAWRYGGRASSARKLSGTKSGLNTALTAHCLCATAYSFMSGVYRVKWGPQGTARGI